MQIFRKFFKFLYKIAGPRAKYWYRLTMFLTKARDYRVPVFSRIVDIPVRLKWGKQYRKDPWGGGLDYMSHPTRIERNILEKRKIGDCDDHAIYWCVALLKSKLASKVWLSFYGMAKEDDSIGGHVVCVFEDFDGVLYYADYGMPKKINYITVWPYASANQRDAFPFSAHMFEVTSIKSDDTPVFGRGRKII